MWAEAFTQCRVVFHQNTALWPSWGFDIRKALYACFQPRVNELTTQAPCEVWLAIANKSCVPQLDYPPLRIVWFSGPLLTEGFEQHEIDGVTVRVTNVARTVVDCFKFR